MEIKVLGTVSPYCKGEHNCPGFLITNDDQKILLDCGNGITKLLDLPNDLKNLTIFISHLHNDHYGDLLSLKYASHVYHKLGLLNEKMKVYIPHILLPTEWEPFSFDKEYNDYKLLKEIKNSYANIVDYDEKTKLEIGNIKISFMCNYHNIKTFSTKLETDNLKIVYTSDLGYNDVQDIISFANKADLLICESSLVRIHNNFSNYHLHAYQSADIARYAQVKNLLLTHFWPETDKNIYLEEAKTIFANTEVAKEGQKILLRK